MLPWRKREVLALRVEARRELAVADVVDLKRFSNRPCTTSRQHLADCMQSRI